MRHVHLIVMVGIALAGLPPLLTASEADSAGRPTSTKWLPITKDAVPAEVITTFEQAAAGATVSGFQKVERKGRLRYTARFSDAAGTKHDVVAYSDGTLLSVETAGSSLHE